MRGQPIVITRLDAARLRELVAARAGTPRDQVHLEELAGELERARIAEAADTPPDLIGLDSRVRLLDMASGRHQELTLVLPRESDPGAGRISVLAPLGTALIGYRAGDVVEWRMPGGLRRMRIENVWREAAAADPPPLAAG
jgi:regulator of nucleoside diphosphate kinase